MEGHQFSSVPLRSTGPTCLVRHKREQVRMQPQPFGGRHSERHRRDRS